MALQKRVSKLEGAYEQVDGRLSDLSSAMDSLRSDMNSLRSEVRGDINGLRTEMNSRFNNLYLLIGGLWATMIGAIAGFAFTL